MTEYLRKGHNVMSFITFWDQKLYLFSRVSNVSLGSVQTGGSLGKNKAMKIRDICNTCKY